MPDRERSTLEEIQKILGLDVRELTSVMLENLERGVISVPNIPPEKMQEVRKLLLQRRQEREGSKMSSGFFTYLTEGQEVRIPFRGEINYEGLRALTEYPEDMPSGGEGAEEDPEREEWLRQETRISQYQEKIEECLEIFTERNAVYKDTFVFLGLQGTVMTLVGDVFRLRNMILQSQDKGRSKREQIEDKLIDVVNQAIISLMMLDEDNFEGV